MTPDKVKTKFRKRAHPYILTILMCTIAIDVMGFGLVLPIFPELFFAKSCVFGGYPKILSYLFYGLGFSLWPLGNFFGTPYLGLLSDKLGRKKVLVICLFVTALSYAFTAISIFFNSLPLFLFSRLFAGFFGGSYDIAQAGVADISLPENKARNMGLITFAVSIGVILGPALSGLTANSELISWFDLKTPFWISAVLAFVNAIFIIVSFKETYSPVYEMKVGIEKVFSSFMFIFKDKRLVMLGLAFISFQFAWGFYITAMPLLLESTLKASVEFTGYFFCVLGIGIAFSILFVQKVVLKRFSLLNTCSYFLLILIFFSVLLLIFQENILYDYISVFMFGMCELLVYSSILALCSNSVSSHEQGQVMGGLGAIASASFFFSGILSPLAINISLKLPSIMLILSFLISFLFIKNYRSKSN